MNFLVCVEASKQQHGIDVFKWQVCT